MTDSHEFNFADRNVEKKTDEEKCKLQNIYLNIINNYIRNYYLFKMGLVPHDIMPVGTVRPYDILLLLVVGAGFEFVTRLLLIFLKRKSAAIRQREYTFKSLESKVKKSRALGPQAFVETSKLERQYLTEQKKLNDLAEQRTRDFEQKERLIKKIGMVLNVIVFFCWYGVSIMEFSGERIVLPSSDVIMSRQDSEDAAVSTHDAYFFPLIYLGMGVRLSKIG